jgi:hypothetical protein
LCSLFPTASPFVPAGTAKAVTPSFPFPLSVTARITYTPPTLPWVMNILVPLITQRSPVHSARVFMERESEPDPGSVRAHAPSVFPEARPGRYRRLMSSDPKPRMWAVQRELWDATVRASEPSPLAISSTAMA